MIIIPVDPKSIKENTNAGATRSAYALPMEKTEHSDGSTTIHRPIQWFNHLPIPRFSYSYIPTTVICNNCSEAFLHTELEGDCGVEMWSNEICPRCGAWDCCNIKFERPNNETLEEALNKRNKESQDDVF